LESFRKVIQKQRLPFNFGWTIFKNLLANQANGAEGNLPQHISRPCLIGWIFQVAPFRKSKILERLKTQTTSRAARLYWPHVFSDEPLLQTNK